MSALEPAEEEPDPDRRAVSLILVVVGDRSTGAELARQIGELACDTLRQDLRAVDTDPGTADQFMI